MSIVKSFNPIVNDTAHILILGSMPGVLSLQANQYYAHPRNAFWRIMATLFNFTAEASYEDRVAALQSSGVALWDVLHSCVRSGSLDSAIETGTRVPNDFSQFFHDYPNIKMVGFNGNEAEKSFSRFVQPTTNTKGIHFVRLPSSSPAHAVGLEMKIHAWKKALVRESTI